MVGDEVPDELALSVQWPVGPTYDEWVGEDNGSPQAWTKYKLRSADWFIAVLEQVGSRFGLLSIGRRRDEP